MADIFIGYAKEDKSRAEQLAQILEAQGWSVWWDVYIPPGKTFDEVIAEALADARCIVVLWSKASITKHWVKTEAERGRQRNILVPVLLDDVTPPLAFELIQAAPLMGWKGEQSHRGFEQLLKAIATIVDQPSVQRKQASRQDHASLGRKFLTPNWKNFVLLASMLVVAAATIWLMYRMPKEVTGKDGASMVLVPAGEFLMGSNDGDASEKPERRVHVDAFYIDKYEVTTTHYSKFLQETGQEQPYKWDEVSQVRDGDRPVIGVTWHGADAYCAWAGKRLPTEAEWEKAARGTDGRKYPWGNEEPTSRHANFNKSSWNGYATLTAVTDHEAGKSPYGIYDMAGNVWEWVADWYGGNYNSSPSRNPTGPASGQFRALRGGSWDDDAGYLRSAARSGDHPTLRVNSVGFRCARDAR